MQNDEWITGANGFVVELHGVKVGERFWRKQKKSSNLVQRFGESWGYPIVARAFLSFFTFRKDSTMQLRFCYFLILSLLLVIGCDRDPVDVITTIPVELPTTDSLTATTSLAGTVRKPDGTIPENAVAEILYGDFVIHSQQVNSGDGSWFFNEIAVSDNPNVLVRITAPGWVPAIRSIPNRSDVVRYANIVLLDRGQTNPASPTTDYTESNGLLTVTIPANGYSPFPGTAEITPLEISLNAYTADEISSVNNAIAAPFLVDDAGTLRTLSNPTIYALIVTSGPSYRVDFNKTFERGIELSTPNAGPTSIIYVLNQETGYWENISTPDGLLEVKQFGYFAVAQASNSVRVSGRIEEPDGTGIQGADVFSFVNDPNGSIAFNLTATDGNGDYEFHIPSGSEGDVLLQPGACGEKQYRLNRPSSDVDLGAFTVGVGTPTVIQGVVEGCTSGIGSTEDLAIEMTGVGIGRVLIPLMVPITPDGSFNFVYDICPLEDITFVPIIQSGPNAGRQGERLVVPGGASLTNLNLKYCDTLVSDALMFMSFQGPTVLSTTPVGTTIHPDTVEVVGATMNPLGEMRWKVALGGSGSQPKVFATYTDSDQTFVTDDYVEALDLTYDGNELFFRFLDSPGVRTDLSDGSTSIRQGGGTVRVKVD